MVGFSDISNLVHADMSDIDRFMLLSHGATDTDALWLGLCSFVTDLGADLLSYHHIPPSVAPDYADVSVLAYGYDADWVAQYRDQEMHRIDPITQLAAHTTSPFRWSDIQNRIPLLPEQRDYLDTLNAWLRGDGLAVPAFGPSARNGYFGVGRRDKDPEWDGPTELKIFWACQAFHHQFCILRMRDLTCDFTLTDGEAKVLDGMARGRSTVMIAALMGRRVDTVDIIIRKIMKKMGVTDRPSAVLRGVALGLVDPDNASLTP